MMFLLLILTIMLLNLYGGIEFFSRSCIISGEGFWNALLIIDNCSLWVAWMIINAIFHLLWVLILTSIQIYQIVFMGMTTNERINRGRYKHFVELDGKSPFSLGPLNNLADFLQCSCFGMCTNKRRNWAVFNGHLDTKVVVADNGSLLNESSLDYV